MILKRHQSLSCHNIYYAIKCYIQSVPIPVSGLSWCYSVDLLVSTLLADLHNLSNPYFEKDGPASCCWSLSHTRTSTCDNSGSHQIHLSAKQQYRYYAHPFNNMTHSTSPHHTVPKALFMWKWYAIYLTSSKQINNRYISPTLSPKQPSMSPDNKTLHNHQSSSCLVVSVDKSRWQSTPDTHTFTDNTTFILDCMGLRSAKIRTHTLVGT